MRHVGSLVFFAASGIFSFGMRTLGCGMWDLVPWPGIKPRPPALGAWSLSHWTAREVSAVFSLFLQELSKPVLHFPHSSIFLISSSGCGRFCLFSNPLWQDCRPHFPQLWLEADLFQEEKRMTTAHSLVEMDVQFTKHFSEVIKWMSPRITSLFSLVIPQKLNLSTVVAWM